MFLLLSVNMSDLGKHYFLIYIFRLVPCYHPSYHATILLINSLGWNLSNVKNAVQLAKTFPTASFQYNIIHQQPFPYKSF
jgi:hypothetical protein